MISSDFKRVLHGFSSRFGQMGLFDELVEGDVVDAAVAACGRAALRRLGAGRAPEVSLQKQQEAPWEGRK